MVSLSSKVRCPIENRNGFTATVGSNHTLTARIPPYFNFKEGLRIM